MSALRRILATMRQQMKISTLKTYASPMTTEYKNNMQASRPSARFTFNCPNINAYFFLYPLMFWLYYKIKQRPSECLDLENDDW